MKVEPIHSSKALSVFSFITLLSHLFIFAVYSFDNFSFSSLKLSPTCAAHSNFGLRLGLLCPEFHSVIIPNRIFMPLLCMCPCHRILIVFTVITIFSFHLFYLAPLLLIPCFLQKFLILS